MIEQRCQFFKKPDLSHPIRTGGKSVSASRALRIIHDLLALWDVTIVEVGQEKLIIEEGVHQNSFHYRWTFTGDVAEIATINSMFAYYAKLAKATEVQWVQRDKLLSAVTSNVEFSAVDELVSDGVSMNVRPLLSYALAIGADDVDDLRLCSKLVHEIAASAEYWVVIQMTDAVDNWNEARERGEQTTPLSQWLTVA